MRGYPPPVVSGGAATVGDTIISIDDIRLDRVLGEGANGFVFDGEDLVLKRRVAVKIWPPGLHHLDRSDESPSGSVGSSHS